MHKGGYFISLLQLDNKHKKFSTAILEGDTKGAYTSTVVTVNNILNVYRGNPITTIYTG